MQNNKILVVCEDKKALSSINDILGKDFSVMGSKPSDASKLMDSFSPDIVVLDSDIGQTDVIDMYQHIRRLSPKIKTIVISSSSNVAPAVSAAKKGVDDYLMKPLEKERFLDSVKRLLKEKEIRETHLIVDVPGSEWLKGISHESKELLKEILSAVETISDVMIFGEKGINKSAVANMIHLSGRSAKRKFVEIDLSSFERDDAETYFWGAVRELLLEGKAEFSGEDDICGTLFLSGFGSVSEHFGKSILKFLKERKKSNVRAVISIEDTEKLMVLEKEGLISGFRKVYVPSLRQRKADIPILVNCYLKMSQQMYSKSVHGISGDVLELFMVYNWPGNYEELKDIINVAVLNSCEKVIGIKELPITANFVLNALSEKTLSGSDLALSSLRREFELIFFKIILEKSEWDDALACQMLDVPRPVFEQRIRELGLVKQK